MPLSNQTPLLSSFPSIPHYQPRWSYPLLIILWATQALTTSCLIYFLMFYIVVPALRQLSHHHVHLFNFVFITAVVLLILSLCVLYTISLEIALYRSHTHALTARTYARLQLLKLIYLIGFAFCMWHAMRRDWHGRAFVRMVVYFGGWVGCLPFIVASFYAFLVARRENVALYGRAAVIDVRWLSRAS